jgi:AcrR family transcriptional regulator
MSASAADSVPTRERLLAAGREIMLKGGFQGLTVRQVAASADANLGSFVYHFGTRDAFIHALLEEWYAPLFARVAGTAVDVGTPVERLRRSVLQLIDFAAENDVFMGRVLMGAAAGEAAPRRFLASLTKRHPRVLMRLIGAAQAEGTIVDDHPAQVLCFLMASVGLPRLIASAWHGPALFNGSVGNMLSRIAKDRRYVIQRLDWAILGLTPQGS